jgi:hypothetical protein
MKPIDEDVLARTLQDLPIGGHVPIGRIDERAPRRYEGIVGSQVWREPPLRLQPWLRRF